MEEEFIFFEFGKFRGIFRAVNLALKFDSFDIYGNIDRLFLTSDFSIPSLFKLLGFKWIAEEFFEFGKGGELSKFERLDHFFSLIRFFHSVYLNFSDLNGSSKAKEFISNAWKHARGVVRVIEQR